MTKYNSNLQDTTDVVDDSQPVVSGTKAVIDNTWSVLSFVLGSEASWCGYDTDEV
jgi:hypothetical protein